MNEDKRLFLLDAYALIFRAYYALIRSPRFTASGLDTSAIFGFVNTLQDLLKRERPSHIAVCFDPGGKTFRHDSYPDYKANRDATPEGIKVAVPYIKRILEAYHIKMYQEPGYEADDVIGTIARQASEQGYETYMVTGDKDLGQLVTPTVKLYHPGDAVVMGPKEVCEKHGIQDPVQVIDLLGLMGDSADNIPGCPGVGPKTASKLIAQYGSIESLLEHTGELKGALKAKVEGNVEQIRQSKWLATIKTDVPVALDASEVERVPADLGELAKIFDELSFKGLATRIIGQAEANVGLPGYEAAASKPASGQQASLFGDDPAAAAPAPNRTDINSHKHSYRVVADEQEIEQLVAQALAQPAVGVHMVAVGDQAMTAQVLGVALALERYDAAYVPLDGFGFALAALAPLFAGNATVVSNDVKRDMVMLSVLGQDFTAPYCDTGVMHYLLEPERRHDTRSLAADVLGYTTISPEAYLGPKGRGQKKLPQVPPKALCDAACELAALQLELRPVLQERLEGEQLTHLLTDIEHPLVAVLAQMELAGVRVDVQALNSYSATLTAQVDTLERECHELAGTPFNTASPAQVGEVLFDRLHFDDKAKKTKSGQYSTTEEVLLKLQDRHPLVGKILQLRGLRKLLSTYVDALPKLINPRTRRLHTTLNQTVTATGRLSSANPNLQNIPVRNEEGREIRKAFIPAQGNVWFSADYSQIELRLVADMAGDDTMLTAFAEGDDVHAITAAKIYHETLESVTADQRRKAKTANFGILYGISAFGLAERLNIPRGEAKELIDNYFATFPKISEFIASQVARAKEQGYVATQLGRRRMLPDINSRNAVVRQFSERNAVNAPIQGTAADIIKIAMVRIAARFRAEGIKSQMTLQVHDELNFDVIPAELDRVQAIVLQEMEGAYQGKVRLQASHAAASNWLDAH